MPAGYSKRSLIDKLGIKPGATVCIWNAPKDYETTLGELPAGTELLLTPRKGTDFIQFFTTSRKELKKEFPKLKSALAQDGMLWVSWPKKASKVESDLNENIVREIGLKHGLVDVKVCAVDEIWSGLKFVYRLEDRKA